MLHDSSRSAVHSSSQSETELTALIQSFLSFSAFNILLIDHFGQTILGASRGLLREWSCEISDVCDRPLYELWSDWPKDTGDTLYAHPDNVQTVTGHILTPNGRIHAVEAILQPLPNKLVLAYLNDCPSLRGAETRAQRASAALQATIETLPDGFVLFDKHDRLVVCNDQYRDSYPEFGSDISPGMSFEDIVRRGIDLGHYPDAVGCEEEWIAHRMDQHFAADQPVVIRLNNERWVKIIERKTQSGGRVGLRMDVTEEIANQERAKQAEQRLLDAIDVTPAGFWLFDKNDRLVLHNTHLELLYDCDRDILVPGTPYHIIIRKLFDRNTFCNPNNLSADQFVDRVMTLRAEGLQPEELQLTNGTWIRSHNHRTSDGGIAGIRIDITAQKQHEAALENAARTDPLTGLRNRRGLATEISQLSEASSETNLAFLHIDLDKFKSINDIYGHASGDYVLNQVAHTLLTATRKNDIVARVGGDEFVICCRYHDDQDVQSLANRILSELSHPLFTAGRAFNIGGSIGISHWSPDGPVSLSEALQDADFALKRAKETGRNRFVVFQNEMRDQARSSAQLANDLIEALNAKQFSVWLQPQVSIADNRIIGFESLVRWAHPERGLLLPGQFLGAANEAGLIDTLDLQVLGLTCAAIWEMQQAGFDHPRVSVNLSTSRLSDPDLLGNIHDNLRMYDLHPDQLMIEILESTLLDPRTHHVVENINALSAAGLSIELDDFGTGHAAITSLREFPVDRIKVDRSLISGIDQDSELRMITSAILNLCQSLGKSALCEGVETRAELDVLRQIGCTEIQGHFIAPPLPLPELIKWLENRA